MDPRYQTSIKELVEPNQTISADTLISKAFDYMNQDFNSFGLTVVENNHPLGILTKEKLAFKLSGRYGFTLHQNKPVSLVMDTDFLSVDAYTPVKIVSDLAMERSTNKLYDFIVVTEKGEYIGIVTIKRILQKAFELEVHSAKQQSPLTGLPGNFLIDQALQNCLLLEAFCVAYFDIDHFKAYNDVYGFEKGDQIIQLVAEILQQNFQKETFIGHIGGDDFIVIANEYLNTARLDAVVHTFEKEARAYYKKEDLKRGYILSKNRAGEEDTFPLVSLTAVAVTNKETNYTSSAQLTEALATLKAKAKFEKQKN